jgi:hypothetical protein
MEDTQQTHCTHRRSDTQTLRQSGSRTFRHSDDAGPVVLTTDDGQSCWPVVLATIAGQCCLPAVLASITVLLASGGGLYCWLVALASTVRLYPLQPQIWFRKWVLVGGRRVLAIAKTIIINSAIIIITICIFALDEHQERISADVCLQMFKSMQTAQIHPLTSAQNSSQMLRSVQMLRSMCVGVSLCVAVNVCVCVC